VFKQELDNNQRKMKVALEKVKLNVVDGNRFDELEFTNVNTPSELKKIQ
jgi:molybdopterin-guanine dinucleotide biosynthesis protein A